MARRCTIAAGLVLLLAVSGSAQETDEIARLEAIWETQNKCISSAEMKLSVLGSAADQLHEISSSDFQEFVKTLDWSQGEDTLHVIGKKTLRQYENYVVPWSTIELTMKDGQLKEVVTATYQGDQVPSRIHTRDGDAEVMVRKRDPARARSQVDVYRSPGLVKIQSPKDFCFWPGKASGEQVWPIQERHSDIIELQGLHKGMSMRMVVDKPTGFVNSFSGYTPSSNEAVQDIWQGAPLTLETGCVFPQWRIRATYQNGKLHLVWASWVHTMNVNLPVSPDKFTAEVPADAVVVDHRTKPGKTTVSPTGQKNAREFADRQHREQGPPETSKDNGNVRMAVLGMNILAGMALLLVWWRSTKKTPVRKN